MTAGRKPYGAYESEQAVIAVILRKRQRRKGKKIAGPWQIANELNAEGKKTRGGYPWSGQSVKRIIQREDPMRSRNATRIRTHKRNLGPSDYLSEQEIEKCRQACDDRQRIIFEVMIRSGLRASEFCSLCVKDIWLEDGKKYIDVTRGKGALKRAVDIEPVLEEILKKHIAKRPEIGRYSPLFLNKKGLPIRYHNLRYLLGSIKRKSGIKQLRAHQLRHTFAMIFYNSSGDIMELRRLMGHTNYATTEIYARPVVARSKETMEKFSQAVSAGRVSKTM